MKASRATGPSGYLCPGCPRMSHLRPIQYLLTPFAISDQVFNEAELLCVQHDTDLDRL